MWRRFRAIGAAVLLPLVLTACELATAAQTRPAAQTTAGTPAPVQAPAPVTPVRASREATVDIASADQVRSRVKDQCMKLLGSNSDPSEPISPVCACYAQALTRGMTPADIDAYQASGELPAPLQARANESFERCRATTRSASNPRREAAVAAAATPATPAATPAAAPAAATPAVPPAAAPPPRVQ